MGKGSTSEAFLSLFLVKVREALQGHFSPTPRGLSEVLEANCSRCRDVPPLSSAGGARERALKAFACVQSFPLGIQRDRDVSTVAGAQRGGLSPFSSSFQVPLEIKAQAPSFPAHVRGRGRTSTVPQVKHLLSPEISGGTAGLCCRRLPPQHRPQTSVPGRM